MKYSRLLKEIAAKENISTKHVEDEMQTAIKLAGLNCSVKEFIKIASSTIKETIYRKTV